MKMKTAKQITDQVLHDFKEDIKNDNIPEGMTIAVWLSYWTFRTGIIIEEPALTQVFNRIAILTQAPHVLSMN